MTQLRALIVDDEPPARARLRRLLQPHGDVTVVGEAADGDEGLRQLLSLRPDVVFLDVNMPGPSGTEVAHRIVSYLPEGMRPAVVFTTAHAEHAVEAFAVEGTDYLLKPIERERLGQALRRVRRARGAQAPTAPQPPPPRPTTAPAALRGHHGAALQPVPIATLRAVLVEDSVAWAICADGGKIRLGDSLAQIEPLLPSPPFARVSRSAIVQTEHIVRLHPRGSTWEAELEGGQLVRISRRRARHLRELTRTQEPR